MKQVYLLLGSNAGDRKQNLKKAKNLIELRCGKIVRVSSLYETEPWGFKDQDSFLNVAVLLLTELQPLPLLAALKSIETETGRTKSVKWGPRVIDIDILFYEDEIVDLPELQVPHPYLHERKFTLAPINEIAEDFVHPVLQKKVCQLLKECRDDGVVNI